MNSSRDAFLTRVKQAVTEGNRAGFAKTVPSRGHVGYQGAGADPIARFGDELTAAGGKSYVVSTSEAAAKVQELVQAMSAHKILLGPGPALDSLHLAERLSDVGCHVVRIDGLTASASRDAFFSADVGISGADFLVAETGSIVVRSKPLDPRSLSLLPPRHIVLAPVSAIVPDLFDLFERLGAAEDVNVSRPNLPSCLSLITGPSKTGDIELRLVTGVHGPGEVHVVLVSDL